MAQEIHMVKATDLLQAVGDDNTWVVTIAHPVTGVLYKTTIQELAKYFGSISKDEFSYVDDDNGILNK